MKIQPTVQCTPTLLMNWLTPLKADTPKLSTKSSFKPLSLNAMGVFIGQSGSMTNIEKSRLGSHIS